MQRVSFECEVITPMLLCLTREKDLSCFFVFAG
jgi:hypothetical protein